MMPYHGDKHAKDSAANAGPVASPKNVHFDPVAKKVQRFEAHGPNKNPLYNGNDDSEDDDDDDDDSYAHSAALSPQRAVDTFEDDGNITGVTSPLSPQKQWEEAMMSRMVNSMSSVSPSGAGLSFCSLTPCVPASCGGFVSDVDYDQIGLHLRLSPHSITTVTDTLNADVRSLKQILYL